MTGEESSKDLFFKRLGDLAEEMIAAHGKDFAMGALIIAARFIAEGKPLAGARNGPALDVEPASGATRAAPGEPPA